MKVKTQKEQKRDEFRRNKTNQHPAYIYARVGSDFKYIGITHSKITKGMQNIQLDNNPNPKDKKTAFARPIAEKDKAGNFKAKEKGWRLTKKDKDKLNKIKK